MQAPEAQGPTRSKTLVAASPTFTAPDRSHDASAQAFRAAKLPALARKAGSSPPRQASAGIQQAAPSPHSSTATQPQLGPGHSQASSIAGKRAPALAPMLPMRQLQVVNLTLNPGHQQTVHAAHSAGTTTAALRLVPLPAAGRPDSPSVEQQQELPAAEPRRRQASPEPRAAAGSQAQTEAADAAAAASRPQTQLHPPSPAPLSAAAAAAAGHAPAGAEAEVAAATAHPEQQQHRQHQHPRAAAVHSPALPPRAFSSAIIPAAPPPAVVPLLLCPEAATGLAHAGKADADVLGQSTCNAAARSSLACTAPAGATHRQQARPVGPGGQQVQPLEAAGQCVSADYARLAPVVPDKARLRQVEEQPAAVYDEDGNVIPHVAYDGYRLSLRGAPPLQVLRKPEYSYVSQLQLSHLSFEELRPWLPVLAGLVRLAQLELGHLHDLRTLLQLEELARALPGTKDLVLRACPLATSRLLRPFAAARFRHLLSLNGELVLEPERKAARQMFGGVSAARHVAGRQVGQQAERRAKRAAAAAGQVAAASSNTSAGDMAAARPPASAGGGGAAEHGRDQWRAAQQLAKRQVDLVLLQAAAVQRQLRQFELLWDEVVLELAEEGWQALYDLPQAY